MVWPFSAWRRLKRSGILGMNYRNVACILDGNPRALFPIVDDKLRLDALCKQIGVSTPAVHAEISAHSQLRHLPKYIGTLEEFVIKPNRGSAGRGVLVLTGRTPAGFLRHNGQLWKLDQIRQHVSDILSGMYSLGGLPDRAIFQQRVHLHPVFEPVAYQGIPDIRVIVYRDEPAMAMLRLPTKASNGRANLHQGGIGVGVDLRSGLTHHAVQRNRFVSGHPDTGVPLVGLRIPFWNEVLRMSRRIAQEIGMGYIGVDIVIDADQGPLLLEANGRPGLAIQMANARGLLPCLAEIDARKNRQKEGRGLHPAVDPLPELLRRSA